MNANRVDAIVDLVYGVMILLSIVLIISLGTRVGIAFGVGVIVSYAIHVAWKMARFDPEWMTQEVAEAVEERLTDEIDEVLDRVEELNERIDRGPAIEEGEERVGEVTSRGEESER